MKKNLLLFSLIICSSVFLSSIVYGQEVTYNSSNQFYYNPFDNSSLGVFNNYIAGTTNKTIVSASTTTTTFNGTVALTSVNGVTQRNNIYGQALPASTDLNTADFEWTFQYKNNSATSPVEPYDNNVRPGPAAGDGAWQYWLTATGNDQTVAGIQGFYMTQVGTNMILRYRNNSNDIQSLITFPITNNTLWAIKVQRLASGTWRIWANTGSGSNFEATTAQPAGNVAAVSQAAFNTYSYSMLACNDLRTTGNNFFFDSFKIYTRRISFSGINAAGNGITQPSFYPNQTGVALFGLQVNMRGTYNINTINIGGTSSTGTNPNAFFTNAKIVKSIDDTFTTTGDNSTLASFGTPQSIPIQSGTFSTADVNYSSGNTDGSYTRVADYFLVVDIASSINYGNPGPYTNFVFSGPSTFTTVEDNNNPPKGGYTNNATTGNNTITFAASAPPTISYQTPQNYNANTAISTLIPTTTGSPTSFSTTGLPAGLTLNTTNGQITGTPTIASAAANYTVTATNAGGGSRSTVINITVNGPPVISYATPQIYLVGTAITPLSPTNTGGAVGLYSTQAFSTTISGPSGVTVNPLTGNIFALSNYSNSLFAYTPAGISTTTGNYTATGIYNNPKQLLFDALGNLYISDYGDDRVVKITPGGTVTNITVAKPLGLAVDAANNIYVASQTTGNIYSIAASSASLTTFKTGFNSPFGVAINSAGDLFVGQTSDNTIYKIAAGTTALVSFATGFSGPRTLTFDASGNLTVPDAPNNAIKKITPSGIVTTILSSGLSDPSGIAFDAAGNLLLTNYNTTNVQKYTATYFAISPALPAGLSFNTTTGVITGTPTSVSAATNYTVTAYSAIGNATATLSIAVLPTIPTVTLGTPVPICGASTENMTASGSTPTGGTYNWYLTASGGTSIANTAAYNPFVGGTTTFYVDYTVSGVTSLRLAVPITVNPEFSSAIDGVVLSYPFDGGTTDISGNLNTGSAQGTPTAVADRNGKAAGAYSFNGTSQYITSTTNINDPNPFSYSIWFKTTVNSGKLVDFSVAATGSNVTFDRSLYLSTTGQLVYCTYVNGNVTTTTSASYTDGLWHHAVVSVGATYGTRIYVDGVVAASNPTYTAQQSMTGYWRIGFDSQLNNPNKGANDYFTGTMDDFVVYNHEITAAEAMGNDMNMYSNTSGYCANNSITLTAPAITGATYSWTDGTTTVTGNPATFSNGATSYNLTVVTATGCTSTPTVVPSSVKVFTWTGGSNSNSVTVPGNWINSSTGGKGVAPSLSTAAVGTETLIIPAGLSFYPVLTNNANLYSINIASGASLGLGGKTLGVGCNIYNNNNTASGILYGANTASSITWNGTVANQAYVGTNTTATATASAQTGSMTVANTNSTPGKVTISGGRLDIYNLLTITTGNLIVASSGTLTLKSSGTLTASVPAIPSAYAITGNVTVERWFNGGAIANRGWRLMSSPVNNSGIAPATNALTFNFNSLKTNLIITGPGGSGNGFDQPSGYSANGPTVLFYNTPNAQFFGLTSLNSTQTRPIGTGFYFYFRGNNTSPLTKLVRTSGAFGTPEANVVGLQTGTLNQQGFSVALSNLYKGYNLVGNPYPSTIALPSSALSSGSTTGFIWTYAPGGSSIMAQTPPFNIASGQGFFVRAVNTGATITFAESQKVATQPTGATLLMSTPKRNTDLLSSNNLMSTTAIAATNDLLEGNINLQLVQDSANYDFARIRLADTYKPTYDVYEDAEDLNGSGQTVFFGAITSDKQLVAIASQPLQKQNTSVFLSVDDNTTGIYTIKKVNITGIPAAYDIWLMDHFKKDSLDLRANSAYNFNLDKSNPATFGTARFEVVIRKKTLPPYSLVSFIGRKTGNDVNLRWDVQNEFDYTSFVLQKSTDNITFNDLSYIQSSSRGSYSFKDAYVSATNKVYYRLKQTDINDNISYSSVVIIAVTGNASFTVFPNPASNVIQFNVTQVVKGSVKLNIYNAMGVLMKNSTFNGQTGSQDISSLVPGNYTIEIIDLTDKKLLAVAKFSKI